MLRERTYSGSATGCPTGTTVTFNSILLIPEDAEYLIMDPRAEVRKLSSMPKPQSPSKT